MKDLIIDLYYMFKALGRLSYRIAKDPIVLFICAWIGLSIFLYNLGKWIDILLGNVC